MFSRFQNIFESNKFGLSKQQMLRWLGKLATVHPAYAKVRPQLAPELFTTDGFTPHAPCISFDAPAHPPAHFHCNTALHHAWSRNRRTSRTGRSCGSIHRRNLLKPRRLPLLKPAPHRHVKILTRPPPKAGALLAQLTPRKSFLSRKGTPPRCEYASLMTPQMILQPMRILFTFARR